MINLRTEGTIIRDHCDDDLLTHHALFSDKTAMYYLQDIATDTLEESKINLQTAINEIDKVNRKLYFLRIEDKYSWEHIGEIGYTVEETTPFGKMVGMGYFIRQKFWGRGYTSEALKELIRFAFEEDGVFRISCGCIKDNIGSEKVMIKCGMTKEAEFRSFVWHDGKLKDRVEYRILKNEWKPV
jgi:ribosomal-protein-alanine N-acetyltransferase